MAETDQIPKWIGAAFEAVQRSGQEATGMPFLRTLAMDADGMEIEVGWPVSAPFHDDGDVQVSSLPGGLCAVVTYRGPYEGIAPAYEAVQAWCVPEHGHELAGLPWESYPTDPTQEPDPAKWRTDVYFPVRG